VHVATASIVCDMNSCGNISKIQDRKCSEHFDVKSIFGLTDRQERLLYTML
jgi:hypothetical protein